MKLYFGILFVLLFPSVVVPTCHAGAGNRFIAIAYHDVVQTRDELASDAVTVDHLIDQFEWFLANDYHPVSIDDLLAARAGKKSLPRNPVLLSWDDGYASFYNLVFPLLKAYNFPAVLALEGSWIEPEVNESVHYGKNTIPRKHFLSWKQLRELADSPLVEIASHSYDLHKGVLTDRFGDKLPAAVARKYDPQSKTYESDKEYYTRIYSDLMKNNRLLQKRLGMRPRVMVWPFGRYTKTAIDAARKAGMEVCLTLNPVPGDIDTLQETGRMYPTLNPGLADFRGYLDPDIKPPVRHFFRVDSRQLLDASPDTEEHFSLFLNRLKELRPAMVVFSPVIENDTGLQALFPSKVLPMLQDRLTRFTWHGSHRGGSSTYLWLPSPLFQAETFAGDEGIRFFEEMGKFAFCQGVIVDAPALLRSLLALQIDISSDSQDIASWDPARHKAARKQLRASNVIAGQAGETLARLDALQKGQPFLEMGLLLPLEKLAEIDEARAAVVFRYFDFLVVDARPAESTESINNALKNFSLQETGLTNKIYVLVHRENNSRELADKFVSLPRCNIINWGYEFDDFLARRPAAKIMRRFVSDVGNPFE